MEAVIECLFIPWLIPLAPAYGTDPGCDPGYNQGFSGKRAFIQ